MRGDQLCPGRIDDFQFLEVQAIKATVSRKQPRGVSDRVCSDQEIGYHPGARAATPPMFAPRDPRECRRLPIQRAERQLECGLRRLGVFRCGVVAGHFRPDYPASNQGAFQPAAAQQAQRRWPELRVRGQNIQQNVGVDRGDHSGSTVSTGPRSSRMISSVDRSSLREPYSSSRASRVARDLVPIRRPSLSLSNSSTCPGRSPSRSRSGLGIVTCPFSDKIAFILKMYDFLPVSSIALAGRGFPSPAEPGS